MKKVYASMLTLLAAASSLTASAQQLPNNGFENNWAKTTPWTSGDTKQVDGLSPESWTIAHVAGYKLGFWFGTTLVSDQASGYNSTYAPKLKNVSNSVATSQIVPGYMTLGTPFNTANTSGSNKDGGSFGGIDFAYRPDAIGFQYQRGQASGSTEPATVVVYSWKGTATQANVRGNIGSSPKTVTMTDRDRNILNMETAYGDTPTYTDDFARIATVNHSITAATSGWTYAELPLQYESTATPEKINVIFSAGNYFSTSPEKDNTLTVDDVKLLYYSRLASLSVNGAAVEGFNSNTYAYTLDTEMPEESAFAFTCLGNSGSGKASLSLDKANAVATITVTNSNNGGTDVDGQTSHVYTLQFKKPATSPSTPVEYEGKMYSGTLNIGLDIIGLDINQTAEVYIKDNGNGTCKFTLPNFTLDLGDGPANFGDIVVENVTMTNNADGTISYAGSVKGLSLADGEIIADVELSGTETADGQLTMNIPVLWEDMTIDVKFNGATEAAPVYEGALYDGDLNIKLEVIGLDVNQSAQVYIKDNGDGTCKFTLPNFTLDLGDGPANFGDIVVENVTMTRESASTINYSGSVSGLELAGGEIVADVELSGTETDNRLVMSIPVQWEGLTIEVYFNGSRALAGIGTITIDNSNAPVEYYNLQGVRVAADNLTPGIYILRQGTDVKKVLVK